MNAEHLERMQTDSESESLGPQMSELLRFAMSAYSLGNADSGMVAGGILKWQVRFSAVSGW